MAGFQFISKPQLAYAGTTLPIQYADIRTIKLPFEPPDTGNFDPRKHRLPPMPLKPWMAYFALIRLGFGTGFLGMPLAISQAGIIMGPIICIVVGLTLVHTQIVLLNCLNEVSRQLHISRVSYRYGFRVALLHGPPFFHLLGRNGPTIVALFIFLSQLSICTVCFIFAVNSLDDVLDWQNKKPVMMIMLVSYLFIQYYIRTLKQIVIMAVSANVLTLAGLCIILYHIFYNPHGEYTISRLHPFNVLLSIGIMLFNLSSIGMILAIDKVLDHPEIMTKRYGVIPVGIMVPSLFAAIYGSLGYWSFGSMQDNILTSLPYEDGSTMVCICIYFVVALLTYPIQSYPGIMVVLDFIEKHDPLVVPSKVTLKRIETVSKLVFVFITFLICYFIPYQGPFVAFCGTLCTNLLAIIFPCVMEICLLYPNRYGRRDWILIKDVIIMTIGIVCWVYGVLACGYNIHIRDKATAGFHAFEA